MGAYNDTPTEPISGTHQEVADQIRAFAAAGASHLQVVADPINRESIEWFAPVLAALDAE
jgi:alkanesulfonate monooxygenase SsuD/methylene tetrahydromethanopterin reductase-like flavin-dependent oxidoreductase (luciferase family)